MTEEVEWCVGLPLVFGEVQSVEKGGDRIEDASIWPLEKDSLLSLSEAGLHIDLGEMVVYEPVIIPKGHRDVLELS